jgi:hypothetical protein
MKTAAADFNGDGHMDLLLYTPAGAALRCLNGGAGLGSFHCAGESWPGADVQVRALDFEGDRQTDLFIHDRVGGAYRQLLSTGTELRGRWAAAGSLHVGDLDGNGRPDLFAYDAASGAWSAGITGGPGLGFASGQWGPQHVARVGDFDGNGAAEVLFYDPRNGQWTLLSADGRTEGGSWAPGQDLRAADINRDGRLDLIIYDPNAGSYQTALSTGFGRFSYAAGLWDPGEVIVLGDVDQP